MEPNGFKELTLILKQYEPLTEYNRNILYNKSIKDIVFQLRAQLEDVKSNGKISCSVSLDRNALSIGSHYLRIEVELIEEEKNKLSQLKRTDSILFSGIIEALLYSNSDCWYYVTMRDCRLID